MGIRTATVVGLFAITLVVAGGCSKSSAPKPETPLELTTYIIKNAEELYSDWEEPKKEVPPLDVVSVAEREDFISAVVLFKGCKEDRYGYCDVTMDITAYNPFGALYGDVKTGELWQGKAAPAPGYTQLSIGYMGIVIEPGDPKGRYKVTAVARDRVAGREVTSSAEFEVTSPPGQPSADDEDEGSGNTDGAGHKGSANADGAGRKASANADSAGEKN